MLKKETTVHILGAYLEKKRSQDLLLHARTATFRKTLVSEYSLGSSAVVQKLDRWEAFKVEDSLAFLQYLEARLSLFQAAFSIDSDTYALRKILMNKSILSVQELFRANM